MISEAEARAMGLRPLTRWFDPCESLEASYGVGGERSLQIMTYREWLAREAIQVEKETKYVTELVEKGCDLACERQCPMRPTTDRRRPLAVFYGPRRLEVEYDEDGEFTCMEVPRG